jgi:tetratricopeptide (TPR) repeat protein
MSGRAMNRRTINPDRLAELEEERRFLLRSLADLEREHAAGDVDEVDYRELKDGYTVRAAATLREIDEGRSALPPRPPTDWRRRLLTGGMVVALIGVVWWALAASSAERLPGQQVSGLDPRDERQVLMAEARDLQFQQPAAAAEKYAQVLESDPDDPEALTYYGWTLALAAVTGPGSESGTTPSGGTGSDPVVAQLREALDSLQRATEIDPAYADPKCFLGIINANFLNDAATALPWVDACIEAGPPADVLGLVQGLRESIVAELDGSLPSVPSVPSATPGD